MPEEKQVDLASLIETAKAQSRKALTTIQEAIEETESRLGLLRTHRGEVIRTAQGALANEEIAAMLGVSERQVTSWARTEPVKRRTKGAPADVTVEDGRTGEVLQEPMTEADASELSEALDTGAE